MFGSMRHRSLRHFPLCKVRSTPSLDLEAIANVKIRCGRWVWQKRCLSGETLKPSGPGKAHILYSGVDPLEDKTVGRLIESAARTWPKRDCLVSLDRKLRLTFADVLERVDRLAAGFQKLGLRKGDRLGIWAPNDPEWYIAFLASARLGLIITGINPAYQQNELEYCIRRAQVKAVVTTEEFKTQKFPQMLLKAKQSCTSLEHIIVYSRDCIDGTRRFSDVESLASRAEVEGIAHQQDDISPYDPCNVQFTSGTTGFPKATLLSHRSLYNNCKQVCRRGEFAEGDKLCLNVPLFHAFGIVSSQLGPLHSGSTLVMENRSFNPIKSVEAIAREKCSVAFGTPTMWTNMLDAQDRLRLPISLKVGLLGGSPASPELFKRVKQNLGLKSPKSIYGLTEVTAVTFQTLPGEHEELTETTVGHVSDHHEVKVVDENGSVVPFGSPGELWIRAYATMMRYWGDEESTKKTLTNDGWLKTGDKFILESNGYGKVIGRLKDMLIRGGENIFPREIEDFLLTHPKVLEAQVIGAYDKVYGEEVCACVRLRSGEKLSKDELRDYCKGKIAHFKIPRYIEFVSEYPKTTSGKVQKHRLKEELESAGVIPAPPKC